MNTFIRYRTSILWMLLQIYCFYSFTVFAYLPFLLFLFCTQFIISYIFMDRMISHVIFDGSRKFHYKRPTLPYMMSLIHHSSDEMISNFKIYIFSNVKMKI